MKVSARFAGLGRQLEHPRKRRLRSVPEAAIRVRQHSKADDVVGRGECSELDV
jgi:hypothetical protein